MLSFGTGPARSRSPVRLCPQVVPGTRKRTARLGQRGISLCLSGSFRRFANRDEFAAADGTVPCA